MSEVEKFKCIGYMVGRSRVGGADYVRLSDFDRVTAERDALRNEVGQVKGEYDRAVNKVDALQQRLTAANEELDRAGGAYLNKNAECIGLRKRADVLEGLLRRVVESSVLSFEQDAPEALESLEADICAALKPAECCTVSEEDRALLDAGDYTPEELFGVGGKPSCPKCAP